MTARGKIEGKVVIHRRRHPGGRGWVYLWEATFGSGGKMSRGEFVSAMPFEDRKACVKDVTDTLEFLSLLRHVKDEIV